MWDGGNDEERVVDDPSAADVRNAVRALDGSRNDLYLTSSHDTNWGQNDVPWLGVCGGPHLFSVSYNVTATNEFYTAVQPDGGDEPVELICGGQNSEFPRYQLVGPNVAVAVAIAFAATGKRLQDVEWERQ